MDRKKKDIPVCVKCKKGACIKTSSSWLCERHFGEAFEKRVSGTVREFSMLKKGEHVAVAVSGGKDSMALLHMLFLLKKRLPMRLSAVLVDEGISGYREKTIRTAKEECKKLGVPLNIISFENEFGRPLDEMLCMERKFGACTYCGVFRRVLINRAAKRIGAGKIAMGHNLDDAVQTLLLNIFRNEPKRLIRFGPLGQKGGGGKFLPRIYPLIRCPEIEVAAWAVMRKVKINFMQCPYANEAMRQNVRRMLNEMETRYPGTKTRAFEAFLEMQKGNVFGKENAWEKGCIGGKESIGVKICESGGMKECQNCGEPSSSKICASCRLLKEFES